MVDEVRNETNAIEKERIQIQLEEQYAMWLEQFKLKSKDSFEKTMQSMNDYMQNRYKNLKSLESRELDLIEKLRNTQ